MTSTSLVPFGREHVEDAARLFAARYRVARREQPLLPARFEDPAAVRPLLDPRAAGPGLTPADAVG